MAGSSLALIPAPEALDVAGQDFFPPWLWAAFQHRLLLPALLGGSLEAWALGHVKRRWGAWWPAGMGTQAAVVVPILCARAAASLPGTTASMLRPSPAQIYRTWRAPKAPPSSYSAGPEPFPGQGLLPLCIFLRMLCSRPPTCCSRSSPRRGPAWLPSDLAAPRVI